MIECTEQEFEEVKAKGEQLYKSFEEVYCPYFKEKIAFTSEGLDHLEFRSGSRYRSVKDQYMRFKLLYLAPTILAKSHTLQGMKETKQFERIRMYSRTESVLKAVTYYEFISLIGRNRIKIILKKIENGQKFFWSIIPFWGMNSQTKSRILHDGNLDED